MATRRKWRVDFEPEPFCGFGRSTFWPFRSRLRTLPVASDLGEVRASIRATCLARSGVYGMVDARDRLIYVGMSTALRKRLVTYFQGGASIRKECRIAKDTDRLLWEEVSHPAASPPRGL